MARLAGPRNAGHQESVQRQSVQRAILEDILEPAANRIEPACRHFGRCGGCALQHLDIVDYRRWKVDGVITTLAQRGIGLADSPKEIFVPAGTRRRAVFAVTGDRNGCQVGFHRSASHQIIDLKQCELLTPALFALIDALRQALLPTRLTIFDELYYDAEAKEAVAFALLGYLHVERRAGNVIGATGARGPRVLGKLTPA